MKVSYYINYYTHTMMKDLLYDFLLYDFLLCFAYNTYCSIIYL